PITSAGGAPGLRKRHFARIRGHGETLPHPISTEGRHSMDANDNGVPKRRTRIERGIYREPSGRYAACFMLHGKPRFRTVGGGLEAARRERKALVAAAQAGTLPFSPRLRFDMV